MFSMSKDATSLALDSSEWLLLLFGAVLGLGIIGEYSKGEWWKRRLRCWQICVIVGVLGELLSDGGIFRFSRRLQTLEGAEIIVLSNKAGTALADADTAISRSDKAKDIADAASRIAGRASKAASSASTATNDLRKQADALGIDLQEDKRKSAELVKEVADAEIAMRPRYLNQQTFASELAAIPSVPVNIQTISDFEARRLASLIESAFPKSWRQGGVSITVRMDASTDADFFFPGVFIHSSCGLPNFFISSDRPSVNDLAEQDKCVVAKNAVLKALKDSGLDPMEFGGMPRELPANSLLIRVGLRPMPGEPKTNLSIH